MVDLKRDFFTKHGLHLNGLGKDVTTKQLACHIHDRFFKVASTPIGLGWKIDFSNQDLQDDEMENCRGLKSNNVKSVANRSSNRIRLVPITRDRDFLW
jgi:hypothetical protein